MMLHAWCQRLLNTFCVDDSFRPCSFFKVKLHGYLVFNKCAPGISVEYSRVYVCEQTLGIAVNLQPEAFLVTLIVERVFRETAFMRSLVCFAQPCNEKAESVGSFSYEPTVLVITSGAHVGLSEQRWISSGKSS